MRSLIDYAVLSLLIERPSYGYELCERFDPRFGDLLPTSQGNVYETLKRLEREGYVEVERVGGPRGRPRIYHRATDAGLAAAQSWLVEHLRHDPRQLELLIRLASVGLSDSEAAHAVLDRYEQECARDARQIAIPSPVPASTNPTGELVRDLIVEQQRRVAAAQLEWVAYARSRITMQATGGPAGESAA